MGASQHVLFVGDKSQDNRDFLQRIADLGWDIHYARNFDHARDVLDQTPCDVGLAALNPQELKHQTETERFLSLSPFEWVALVDETDLDDDDFSRLLSQLFFACHTSPLDAGQVDCLLKHALAMRKLSAASGTKTLTSAEYEMVGTTPAMQHLQNFIRRVAAVDAPVFISGESGTGKELAARAVHERSPRREGPFIAVNCGALPGNLIQSELFGYEKGAFTGASQKKIGRIEAAQGGTLFLDEIGDLPHELQVNLLRFLEDHQIQRVGGLKEIPVDVRIVAATHVDLEKAVEEGRFREDLYHRLNVLELQIPALRDRQEDIEILARHFFDKFSSEKSLRVKGFSQEALILMRHYDWPGNIRELLNRVRRSMVMCENRLIHPVDLGLERRKSTRQVVTLEQARDNAEHEAVMAALARNKDNIQGAAKDLGVSRVTLYRLIEKHHILRNGNGEERASPTPRQSASVIQLSSL